MVALINNEVLDTPMIDQTNFGPDMDRWITNIVDIINANFSPISSYLNNIISSGGLNLADTWPTPVTVPVMGLTSSGYVNVNLISTTNPGVTIVSAVAGTNDFVLTFSADPGASAIIVYQAFMSQPQ